MRIVEDWCWNWGVRVGEFLKVVTVCFGLDFDALLVWICLCGILWTICIGEWYFRGDHSFI